MKSCFLILVLIIWQASIALPCGSAQASICSDDDLSCDILKDGSQNSSRRICISSNTNSNHPYQNFTLEKGSTLTFKCTWMQSLDGSTFEGNLYGPRGWKVLLRVQSSRNLKVEAGDIHIDDTTHTGGSSIGSEGDTNSNFDSVEDRYFDNTDQFLSRTNKIWITASVNPVRKISRSNSTKNEIFEIITRTANVTDSVDTQLAECAIVQMHSWDTQEYSGISTESNGSFSIQCNQGLLQNQTLISFFYNITIIINSNIPDSNDGLIQLVYTGAKYMIMNDEQDLYVTCDLSQCDSFWIRFNASGKMELNIYNVTVQGLIYNDDVTEPSCMSNTSPSTTLPSSTSHDYTSNSSISPSSTSTTAEGNASFTQANMTTWFSDMVTMTTERMAADSLPIFLIPTVSVLAFSLLVFLAVLCICLRKRCHTKQSRGRESAPLDDPAFSNNEQHEYCEVRPSVKSPPDKTASGGHKNYAFVVTGPAMVMADEETVHSDDKTAKVKTPTANNKVLSNGPVYTLVDMEKKALDREEKADKARNRGNECVCNVDRAYETVELDDAFGDKGGQTEGKELNSSSMKPAPRSSSIKKDNSGAPMNQYEQMQLSDKGITDIHKTPECHTNHDEPELLGTSPTEPYDVPQLGFKSSVSSDFSKGDIQTKGQSSDDLEHAYQIVSGPSSSGVSSRPDSYPLGDYETVTVSPPVSPEASASLRPDSYPLSDYETVSPPMSPVAMASEQERPYDTLQRGPDIRKQTATSPTASTVDKKAKEEADHEDAFNVYNEIATPDVALSEEGSEAYQHLQRPLSKRPKAGAPLPEIPDEGYGRLDLEGFGASNQTDSQGPKTIQVDPMYAILEKPAEENVPDDDDPEYDLLDACM